MNVEENMTAAVISNVETASGKKKSKKAMVGQPDFRQAAKPAQDGEKTMIEQASTVKKRKKIRKKIDTETEGLKSECEACFFDGNAAQAESLLKKTNVEIHDAHGLVIQKQVTSSGKSPNESRKGKKDQDCPRQQGKEAYVANAVNESAQQKRELPKKKSKKCKDFGHNAEKQDAKSSSDVQAAQHACGPINLSKQPMDPINELERGQVSSKKKKYTKDLWSQDAPGGMTSSLEFKLKGSKDGDNGNIKDVFKKGKQKETCDATSHDCNLNHHSLVQRVMSNEENKEATALSNVPSEKKKAKKGDKMDPMIGQPYLGLTAKPAQDAEKAAREQGLREKKRQKSTKDNDTKLDVVKSDSEKALFDGILFEAETVFQDNNVENHGAHDLEIQKEFALSEKSLSRKRKKDKKNQDYEPHQENEVFLAKAANETAHFLWQNGGVAKKKSKIFKDLGHKAEALDGVIMKSVSDLQGGKHAEECERLTTINISKQSMEPVLELETGKVSTKKKKVPKEVGSRDARSKKLLESKLEGSKDDEYENTEDIVKEKNQKVDGDALNEDRNSNLCRSALTNDEEDSAKKTKEKKSDEKNAMLSQPEFGQTARPATNAEKTTTEKRSKNKNRDKNAQLEYLKSEREKDFFDGTAAQAESIVKENNVKSHDLQGMLIQKELASSQTFQMKKRRKSKNDQNCLSLQEKVVFVANAISDSPDVLPEIAGVPRKNPKKSKNSGHKVELSDDATVKSPSDVQDSQHAEELDGSKSVSLSKKSMEPVSDLDPGEVSAKKRKHIKEVERGKDHDHRNGNDNAKKRKQNKDDEAGEKVNQDLSHFGSAPEKLRGADRIPDEDVDKYDLGSLKAKKTNNAMNTDRTPSGALAFKRVDVEKVKFLDPRLTNNSYWAKDGAEEGYGARAQEVLGSVRGRDFRHEKTKKKRGSYRGGIIGLESHSIKFENSDDED